jgi:hypothetical protein
VLVVLDVPGELSGSWSGDPAAPVFSLTGEIAGEVFTVSGTLTSE